MVRSGKPFLGICLGLQLLFEESEEFGPVAGLGLLGGKVVRFAGEPLDGLKIPQIGWNRLKIRRPVAELAGLEPDPYVYFVHSYYVVPADPEITVWDTPLDTNTITMSRGAPATAKVTIPLPGSLESGTLYYLGVWLDHDSQLLEYNEINNRTYTAIVVN